MSEKSQIDLAVGRTLNRLRVQRGLTASALAEAAGLSAAMVSRIENGQVSPSLASLSALAGALGVPVMALVAEEQSVADVHFVKAGQGLAARRVTPDHAHAYTLLGTHAGPEGRFEAAMIRIERDAAGTLPGYRHEGVAFLHVLSGGALYRCGPETFALAPGDSLSFDTKLAHGVARITADHVAFLSVTTRPQ